jgi:hypothetical protein
MKKGGDIMGSKRDTYKYLVKRGNKVLDGGITGDLKRREQERQREYPGSHLMKVGIRTTEEGARKWEKKKGYS